MTSSWKSEKVWHDSYFYLDRWESLYNDITITYNRLYKDNQVQSIVFIQTGCQLAIIEIWLSFFLAAMETQQSTAYNSFEMRSAFISYHYAPPRIRPNTFLCEYADLLKSSQHYEHSKQRKFTTLILLQPRN